MIVIASGGRAYSDRAKINKVLSDLRNKDPDLFLIQGGGTGADNLIAEWAKLSGVPCAIVPALWDYYGPPAGPIRNKWMLILNPELVVAFPGGPGTENMVKQASARNIPIHYVE